MAGILWSQSPRVTKTGDASYTIGAGESLADAKLKAIEKARTDALEQIVVLIDHEKVGKVEGSDSILASKVKIIAGAYITRLPNRTRMNFKLADPEDLSYTEVGIRGDFAFEKVSCERALKTYVEVDAISPELDELIGQIGGLEKKITKGVTGGIMAIADLKEAQEERHSLYNELGRKMDGYYQRSELGTKAARDKYIKEKAEQIAFYLDYLFRDPGFRFEFKFSEMRVENINEEKVYLEIPWEKQLHAYNQLLFDDLNFSLHYLLKDNPTRFDLVRSALKRVADKHDHISIKEVDSYAGHHYNRVIDYFFHFDPDVCNVSLAIGNRGGKPLSPKIYLSSYQINGNIFSFHEKYLHAEIGDSGSVRMKIERKLLSRIESMVLCFDYREDERLKDTKIVIRGRQARERKRNYWEHNEKIQFNLFTATFMPRKTDHFQSHEFRIRLDYGFSEYHSVVRSNQFLSSRVDTTSTGSTVILDTYALGEKDTTRGSFTSYGLSLNSVLREDRNTSIVLEFKGSYHGLGPWELYRYRKFDGILVGSFGTTFESQVFWRHGLSINYGGEVGYFMGPEFPGGGFIGRAEVGLGLNVTNWLGFRLQGSYAYARSMKSRAWHQPHGDTIEVNRNLGDFSNQRSLDGGPAVQLGIVFNM